MQTVCDGCKSDHRVFPGTRACGTNTHLGPVSLLSGFRRLLRCEMTAVCLVANVITSVYRDTRPMSSLIMSWAVISAVTCWLGHAQRWGLVGAMGRRAE